MAEGFSRVRAYTCALRSGVVRRSRIHWLASFYMDMAERYRVIRFDPRGTGLSGEPPGGWGATTPSGTQQGMSTVDMGLDIVAVAAALGLDSFALMGSAVQSPIAIAHAATHPQVSELILCEAMASIANGWLGPILRIQIELDKVEEKAGGPVFTMWERVGPPEDVPHVLKIVYDAQDRQPTGSWRSRSWRGMPNRRWLMFRFRH